MKKRIQNETQSVYHEMIDTTFYHFSNFFLCQVYISSPSLAVYKCHHSYYMCRSLALILALQNM